MSATKAKDKLQALYDRMLKDYSGGLSNTSTKKFDSIKKYFAELLDIPETEVYAVGSGTKPTNLEVRLTQGVQATKHTIFGIGFLKAPSLKRADQLADSALVTVEKFLGRKKASYDAVGILVDVGGKLHFLRLLELSTSKVGKKLKGDFPEMVARTLSAAAVQTASAANQASLFDPAPVTDKFEDSIFQKVVNLLDDGFAGVIFTGPPGTSKSHYAARIAARLVDYEEGRARFVQFHPSYQYEDFVEGFVPKEKGDGFELKPKLLLEMCDIAEKSNGELCVLVIDELSRSDPARVFGEALTYVEMTKREQPFHRASGKKTTIPKNLIFLATMNPMDRGVDEVDAAFERRFAKISMNPDSQILEKLLRENKLEEGLRQRLVDFFAHLIRNKNSSSHIGHAYFHRIKDAEGLSRLWDNQLRFHFERAFRLDHDGYLDIERKWLRIFVDTEESDETPAEAVPAGKSNE